jgi:hypothetical protein
LFGGLGGGNQGGSFDWKGLLGAFGGGAGAAASPSAGGSGLNGLLGILGGAIGGANGLHLADAGADATTDLAGLPDLAGYLGLDTTSADPSDLLKNLRATSVYVETNYHGSTAEAMHGIVQAAYAQAYGKVVDHLIGSN